MKAPLSYVLFGLCLLALLSACESDPLRTLERRNTELIRLIDAAKDDCGSAGELAELVKAINADLPGIKRRLQKKILTMTVKQRRSYHDKFKSLMAQLSRRIRMASHGLERRCGIYIRMN